MNKIVLKELLEIKAKVDSLIFILQSNMPSSTASIEEIRKVAILEEIYRLGGSANPEQISAIAKKYGKTPSSTAGYYSGKKPSLESYINPNANLNSARRLTSHGISMVMEYRNLWGNDWIERIPLDIVGNPNTQNTEIAF